MQYLLTLLGRPAQDVAAAQLAAAVVEAGAQPLLDDRARRELQRRVRDLEEDLDEADRAADVERSARLRAELDALLDEVQRAVRPGGRSRSFADSGERARTSVQKALRRALANIGATAPLLADGLARSLQTGTICRFDPVPGVPSRWEIH
jgi:hypothetical protein